MTRVQIDLNVRCAHNRTYAGLEDADGPLVVGAPVVVYEPEDGIEGNATVAEIDQRRCLVYLDVDWRSLRESA